MKPRPWQTTLDEHLKFDISKFEKNIFTLSTTDLLPF